MKLYVETPLWEMAHTGRTVLLKMEAFQPSGSFKQRGMSTMAQAALAAGATALISASGGNAGLAVADSGRKLGVPVTVVVPERTSAYARELLLAAGATVIRHGDAWDDAHRYALVLAAEQGAGYVHPFDGPEIWAGHATMVAEAAEQGPRPDAVVLSVGGGGLLCGVLEGMHQVGWHDVPLLAVETEGAASYAAALAAGAPVELGAISTIAVTLSARRVCQAAVDWAARHEVRAWQVSDQAALRACLRFADQQRVLVEPACGAALAALDDPAAPLAGCQRILVIVCGGAAVTIGQLAAWQVQLGM